MTPSSRPPAALRHALPRRVSGPVCPPALSHRFRAGAVPLQRPSARDSRLPLRLEGQPAPPCLSDETPHRIENPSARALPGFSSTPDFVAALRDKNP